MNKERINDFVRAKLLLSKYERNWRLNEAEEAELGSLMKYFWVRPLDDAEKKYIIDKYGTTELNDDYLENIIKKYWN